MKDGRRMKTAGIVLVRQKPGSAKGVMFITIEDETGVSNLVIWPQLYEQQRRVILTSRMFIVEGYVQREGDVVHVIAKRLTDYSDRLAAIGDKDVFPLPSGRGDEARTGGGGVDSREKVGAAPRARDIYVPDLHIDSLRVKTRDFR